MQVLFTASDRDLLSAYKQLLTEDGFPTETAFDGTQVVRKLSEEQVELLILSSDIPRIPVEQLIKSSTARGIPVIELSTGGNNTEPAAEGRSVRVRLALPFTPKELAERIRMVTSYRSEKKAGESDE